MKYLGCLANSLIPLVRTNSWTGITCLYALLLTMSASAQNTDGTFHLANDAATTLAYHPRGRLTSREVDGQTTVFEYDNVGQLDRVT